MGFLRILFGKKTGVSAAAGSAPEKEYVICPACGAGYNTEMVLTSILMTSPYMADMENWSTRVNSLQELPERDLGKRQLQ